VLGIILAGLGWAAVLLRNSRALTLWVVAEPPCRDARGQYDSGEFKRCAYRCDIFWVVFVFFFFIFFFYYFGALIVRRSSSVCESNAGADGAAAESSSNTSLGPSHQTRPPRQILGESKSRRRDLLHSTPTRKGREMGAAHYPICRGRVMKASPAGPSRS
jgi:hypothetical protein